MDSSNSSLMDVSREWKEKADKTLKASLAELSKGADKQELSKRRRSATRAAEFTTSKYASNMANLAQEMEENHQNRQEWTKTQINEINEQTRYEIESLDALRAQQQEIYQAQLAEKNEVWEKVVLERREEAAQLRSMISHLTSAISVARNEAKADIDEAKRRANESTKVIRATREKQIQQIADLTNAIQKEKSQFEIQAQQIMQANESSSNQKKEQLSRLQTSLLSLRSKLKDKENTNDSKFRQQAKIIRELKAQLQQVRETEKQKQLELMNMRKMCASISRKISARKDETASLKRQLAMINKDNEELQNEIVKMETQMFPQVFRSTKL